MIYLPKFLILGSLKSVRAFINITMTIFQSIYIFNIVNGKSDNLFRLHHQQHRCITHPEMAIKMKIIYAINVLRRQNMNLTSEIYTYFHFSNVSCCVFFCCLLLKSLTQRSKFVYCNVRHFFLVPGYLH